MRITDILLAFPSMLLALTIVSISGPGLTGCVVAVGISQTPTFVRMVRGMVLMIKDRDYVQAARTIGAHDSRLIVRHILPNTMGPYIALCTLSLAWGILSTASLSFLGFGVRPPVAELGSMLYQSRDYLRDAWWVATSPGVTIMLSVLAFSMLGDGLRDMLDPTLRKL